MTPPAPSAAWVGWYGSDADGHVVAVNMVYHEQDGTRLKNDRTDTDAALAALPRFARLKRLSLTRGQVTDASMPTVAKLTGLEELFVWETSGLTDASMEHLEPLRELVELHLSGPRLAERALDADGSWTEGMELPRLGDGLLRAAGTLPKLRTLSVQGHSFTDEGFRQLADHPALRQLHVGLNDPPLTDGATSHLRTLTGLEHLDLQRAALTDAGIAPLSALTRLRVLHLAGADGGRALTDATAATLVRLPHLRRLLIEPSALTAAGIRRLAGCPRMEELSIETSAVSAEEARQLEREFGRLRLRRRP